MPFLLAIFGALGGLAFWRRKQIGDDAQRISHAARKRVQGRRFEKKKLLAELGQHYYASSTNGNGVGHEADMTRIVDQLIRIDEGATEEESTSDETTKTE